MFCDGLKCVCASPTRYPPPTLKNQILYMVHIIYLGCSIIAFYFELWSWMHVLSERKRGAYCIHIIVDGGIVLMAVRCESSCYKIEAKNLPSLSSIIDNQRIILTYTFVMYLQQKKCKINWRSNGVCFRYSTSIINAEVHPHVTSDDERNSF